MHWKQMTNPNYLGAFSLDGICEEITLTIKEVKQETITGTNGMKDVKPVAYFSEKTANGISIKPMILNATNCKAIASAYGTSLVENWAGKQITVYILRGYRPPKDPTPIDVLRVRPAMPVKALPVMSPSHKNWSALAKAIKGGTYSIDKLVSQYTITDLDLVALEKEVANA